MPRPRSNIGRRSRCAIIERKKRSKRTEQKRLEDNERIRVRISQKRAEELPDQREKRLKASREDARKKRAAHLSQQRQINVRQRLLQIQYLNDHSAHDDAFSFEPDIQCTLIENTKKVCQHCTEMGFEEEASVGGYVDLNTTALSIYSSFHGELSRSPHFPGDTIATPQVVIGKCPSEKEKKDTIQSYMDSNDAKKPPGVLVVNHLIKRLRSQGISKVFKHEMTTSRENNNPNKTSLYFSKASKLLLLGGLSGCVKWIENDYKKPIYKHIQSCLTVCILIFVGMEVGAFITQTNLSEKQAADLMVLGFSHPIVLSYQFIISYHKERVKDLLYKLCISLKNVYNDPDLERVMIKRATLYSIAFLLNISFALISYGYEGVSQAVGTGNKWRKRKKHRKEADLLPTAMYSSGWQNCRGTRSQRVRKLLVIAMTLAQKRAVIRSFGTMEISYRAYVSMVKASYSAFSLLY
ncbi:jg26157 [Pararge aegeria aegeria]|uniref:Jg26157 protein n=1 Tax=Pararge aegeria aegeria TaxID=348720 RepID=A0A8S4S1D4_9NEOP|nr:jg26157 [Pararge aegeria aegeria]